MTPPPASGWCLGYRRHAHYVAELFEGQHAAPLCAACLAREQREQPQ